MAFLRIVLFLPLVASSLACSGAPQDGGSPSTPATESRPGSEAAEEPPAPNALATRLDKFFDEASKKDAFSGSVIVVDGGKTVLSKGYGFASRKTKEPNAPSTIFRIASMSKQFTAAAMLALVADGKVKLDDPVSKHLPEYPKENLEKDGVVVTIHHLLSHTSGLPDAQKTDYFKASVWKKPIDKKLWMESASSLPLLEKPGTRWVYSNYGYFLAAVILERVAGTSYEAFLRERILEPNGMNDTGTFLPADKKTRYAVAYAKDKTTGELETLMDDPAFGDPDVTWAFGSGQIYSTVEDMARWDRALAGHKLPEQDLLFKKNLQDYGYGFVLGERNGVPFAWHNGALKPLGFTSYIVRVPSKDRSVAYLANLDRAIVTESFELDVEKIATSTP
jgi:CubicO group peptidase (beta-lactamase class C family)